jgi:23S rRNA (pseudouridine1915-N3)-methyltransferase
MRLLVAAVGRIKDGPDRALLERYLDRLAALGKAHGLGPVDAIELAEGRADDADARRADEAGRLSAAARGCETRVVLDERGKAISSAAFADLLRRERDAGTKGIAFLIGGPDGHGEAARNSARVVLSLGAMTLPHGLARIVLAEQLYRAATIIAGHPYHRG